MTVLIGLCGRRGGGKDTACDFIRGWGADRGLTVARRSFADKLKLSAMTALGFVVEESDAVILADALKEMGEITTCIPDQSVLYTISGRKFLQLYGTEAHRDVFGPNFWVDALLPLSAEAPRGANDFPAWSDNFRAGDSSADIAVIADVRFDNEATRIRELGGVVCSVERPGGEKDVHSSEAGISRDLIDWTLDNSGSLAAFEDEVRSWMTANFKSVQLPEGQRGD